MERLILEFSCHLFEEYDSGFYSLFYVLCFMFYEKYVINPG